MSRINLINFPYKHVHTCIVNHKHHKYHHSCVHKTLVLYIKYMLCISYPKRILLLSSHHSDNTNRVLLIRYIFSYSTSFYGLPPTPLRVFRLNFQRLIRVVYCLSFAFTILTILLYARYNALAFTSNHSSLEFGLSLP